jgi:DNA-binding CsgD family transcriptional regulator
LVRRLSAKDAAAPARPDAFDLRLQTAASAWKLTGREQDVLRWLVMGDANKEIAVKLACHEGTVERHVTSLLVKARCDGRSRLVAHFWTRL